MVRMAAGQIESLCPQVINAARILAARPKSKVSLHSGRPAEKLCAQQISPQHFDIDLEIWKDLPQPCCVFHDVLYPICGAMIGRWLRRTWTCSRTRGSATCVC